MGNRQDDGFILLQTKRSTEQFAQLVLKGFTINHLAAEFALDTNNNQIYLQFTPKLIRQITRLFDALQWQAFILTFCDTFRVHCSKPATKQLLSLAEQDFTFMTRTAILNVEILII